MNKNKIVCICVFAIVSTLLVITVKLVVAVEQSPTATAQSAAETSSAKRSKSAAEAPCLDVQAPAEEKAAADGKHRWDKKQLTVSFLDGSQQLRQRVTKSAKGWEQPSGITFKFVAGPTTDIRVSFSHVGHYSQIGNLARLIDPTKETMNLEFTDDTSDEDVKMITLHEFGHVLGLIHEHQSAGSPIVWDEEQVMAYYQGYPNYWSALDIRENVLNKYQDTETMRSTAFDPKSIMLYPIQKQFTKNGFSSDWNHDLSPMDRTFIHEFYKDLVNKKAMQNLLEENERIAAAPELSRPVK